MDLQRIKKTNELLASHSTEELQARAEEHNRKAREDFKKLKKALNTEDCSFCS